MYKNTFSGDSLMVIDSVNILLYKLSIVNNMYNIVT